MDRQDFAPERMSGVWQLAIFQTRCLLVLPWGGLGEGELEYVLVLLNCGGAFCGDWTRPCATPGWPDSGTFFWLGTQRQMGPFENSAIFGRRIPTGFTVHASRRLSLPQKLAAYLPGCGEINSGAGNGLLSPNDQFGHLTWSGCGLGVVAGIYFSAPVLGAPK